MTRYDLLKLNQSVLQIFISNRIDPKEVLRLEVFEEFINRRNRGEKYNYVLHLLAEKHHCEISSIRKMVKRMRSDIKVG